jgi:hypothetical protein
LLTQFIGAARQFGAPCLPLPWPAPCRQSQRSAAGAIGGRNKFSAQKSIRTSCVQSRVAVHSGQPTKDQQPQEFVEMFTVKHVFAADSTGPLVENLYVGERVTFHPGDRNLGALEIRSKDALVAALWGGKAFVMNENGKTVAVYDLPRFADHSGDDEDPDQPYFAEFSREKDGGLAAEAVETLRRSAPPSRTGPNGPAT